MAAHKTGSRYTVGEFKAFFAPQPTVDTFVERERSREDDPFVPYHGETHCRGTIKKTGKPCENAAYWAIMKRGKLVYMCGVHSKRMERHVLVKNPNAKQERLARYMAAIEAAEAVARDNLAQGTPGRLTCVKKRMMRVPTAPEGTLIVCPNYRDGGIQYGKGFRHLSPKAMGPVAHGQPGLPDALSIENFHQFNKVFPSEADANGDPKPAFFETQRNAYLDPKPYRHKPAAHTTTVTNGIGRFNKNIPLYSIWINRDGEQIRCTYFESRQFYCTFYERFCLTEGTVSHDEFTELLTMLRNGMNVQITGYDGYDFYAVDDGVALTESESVLESVPGWPDLPEDARRFYRCYLDTSRPFGHEMVLCNLLLFPDSPGCWPWRHFTEYEF